ncbi:MULTISPECIES: alpha/beta hydrolase [Bhargavaea]|uniref:Alpha/beta hydrolase n=1 Tax=Bhargavaea changchunensis TaxID=2134037 RepID=A0ABW2NAY8_9BACL|nr:alpha/beta hydrolase [Bhargavaea sp. CC-171006]
MVNYDPQVTALIELMKQAGGPPVHTLTPEQARQVMDGMNAVEQVEEVGSVEDRKIPGPECEIPIRIYKPQNAAASGVPVLVYYHGGGWVVGSVESYDPVCRKLVNRAECIVVSVDYRLAPEHKFPAAVIDCQAAFEWVKKNAAQIGGDPNRVAVGGDSAGGNLAAVVAANLKDSEELKVAHQLLVYPTTGTGGKSESYQKYGTTCPIIPTEVISYFWNHYWRDASDEKHPDFSVYSREDVSGAAPATIIAAQYDPSLDDSKLYAQKLIAAGIDVDYREYPGMIHGFFTIDALDKGIEAIEDACNNLKAQFEKLQPAEAGVGK